MSLASYRAAPPRVNLLPEPNEIIACTRKINSNMISAAVEWQFSVFNNRPAPHGKSLTSGPGRLAQALAITRVRDNGKDMTSPRTSDLYIVQDDFKPGKILEGPRVGITKAVDQPLRYVLANNPFVSGKAIR